jgi:hypothetical protein
VTLKEYVGGAPPTTLSGDISNSTLSITVASGTGYPTGTHPFVLGIGDPLTSGYEKVLCTARSGDTFTVDASGRGYDDTTAQAHTSGVAVNHVLDAASIQEANTHANDGQSTAHAASKISYAGGTGMSATNVEAALDELATEKLPDPGDGDEGDVLTSDGAGGVTWGTASSSGLLAMTAYNPSSAASYTVASASDADVDATNLKVAFTVPASGSVVVRLSAVGKITTGGGFLKWGLREGSTTVVTPCYVLEGSDGNYVQWIACTKTFVVTGLTPGASKTYKWAWNAGGSGSTAAMAAGGQASGQAGPAVMEVMAVPS